MPESTTCSEDDDSSEEESTRRLFKCPPISTETFPQDGPPSSAEPFAEMDMETIDPLSEPLSIPDFMPSATHSLSELTDSSQSQGTWSSIDTPIHSSSWSVHTGSPTSSHISSDYPFNQSPFMRRVPHTIGKSAWGAQDWFSANPRLDTTFSSSGSSFADGLSPAPSSPFSFHHLNHGVMDRYDLFPTTFHDFASEVGVGDTHSTFSDPEMFSTNSFRGFTHHSSYAGDLIFGARTHQPQQSYYGPGFGFGTPGLGLSGMQPPSGMHSMQMHTPALPGIDEIELASITLNDQAEVPASGSTSEVGIQKDDTETSMNIATTLELLGVAPHNIEDLVDLAHSTPPATPLTTSRPMRPLTHVHSSTSHGRSISVPPSEPRSIMTRSTQVQTHSQPVITTTRSLPFFDALSQHTSESAALHATDVPDLWKPPTSTDFHNLPFLDLHYYSGSHSTDGHHDTGSGATDTSRQGQALDLARSSTSLKSGPPGAPYSSVTQALQTAQALLVETPQEVGVGVITATRQPHQRGMSFVSPQDLQLRKVSDNKRKRASWDGAAF